MKKKRYTVGSTCDAYPRGEQGLKMIVNEQGMEFYYLDNDPNPLVIEGFQNLDPINIHILTSSDAMFVLFGVPGVGWAEIPFNIAEKQCVVPVKASDFSIDAYLVKNSTGEVLSAHHAKASAEFAQAFIDECAKQLGGEFSRLAYLECIQEIYRMFSPTEMAERAGIRLLAAEDETGINPSCDSCSSDPSSCAGCTSLPNFQQTLNKL